MTDTATIPPFSALLVEHGVESTNSIVELTLDDLPPGDVTDRGRVFERQLQGRPRGDGRAAASRRPRLVPGIDLAGTVVGRVVRVRRGRR